MNPALRQILLSAPFTPSRLFRAGEQGAYFDPSDWSTLFQDSAGTTPVTAVDQPVGKILDKSGRGNHATQATAASRPVLKQDAAGYYYLNFDGIDDGMATAAIDFTGTDKMTVFAGMHKASDAAAGSLLELGTNSSTNTACFGIFAPSAATANYRWMSNGSILPAAQTASPFAAPTSNVLTALGDIAGDSALLRVNGVQAINNTGDQGTGNYSNAALYIGRRGGSSLPFNGRLYSLIIRGAATDASTISKVERLVGRKQGIAL